METVYKDSMCRCCASEGSFKDFTASYEWMGVEEVYADMLKDCFDITLSSPVPGNSNGGICEVCVTQLRNAFNFKKQVQNTEERFKKMQEVVFKPETIKIEIPNDDMDINSDNLDDDFSGPDYEVPIKFESSEEKPKKRTRASTSAARAKRAKPDGETSSKRVQRTRKVGRKQVSDPLASDDNVPKKLMPGWKGDAEIQKHFNNIGEILKASNATPIRCHDGKGYVCCFCPQQFPQPSDLKTHTTQTHEGIKNAYFIKKVDKGGYHIKLDITALCCNICKQAIPDLTFLIDHLTNVHERKIYTDVKNHIVPFKFDTEELRCFMCLNIFTNFKSLLEHMNNHVRNYICELCDAGFVYSKQLKLHIETHNTGSFKCELCDKQFLTEQRRKSHVKCVHSKGKLNKCGYCKESFREYRSKLRHMLKAHGVRFEVKCTACERSFSSQRQYRTHMQRDHLLERRHSCKQCDMKFYASSQLKDHMEKHVGLRKFSCEVCMKAFGRKSTLLEHLRIHSDDRRYKCEVCGQAFVQKCSWRAHMKAKHGQDWLKLNSSG